jgi:hypothetical protein
MSDRDQEFNISRQARRRAAAFLLLVLTAVLAGCSSFKTFELQSRSPEQPIVIDGQADDWAGRLFVVEGQEISLGILNDKEYLYVCLRTDANPMRAQILRAGLTVWLDPSGGKKKALGIRFPIGLNPEESEMPRRGHQEAPESEEQLTGNLSELEVIRPGNEGPEKFAIAEAKGVEIAAVPSGRRLVYELKIALAQSEKDPIAVGTSPGKVIGVGFETGKIEYNDLPRRRGGMIGRGIPGMGGMGRGGMGGPGRWGGGREPQLPENLRIWATVRLSSGENPKTAGRLALAH